MNLAKYRKAQSDLDEAEQRLEENAAELSLRSRLKNSATATRAGGAVRLLYLLIAIASANRRLRTRLSLYSSLIRYRSYDDF